MRVLLGQWGMVARLRSVPDTVDEFTGFFIEWDLIAGTSPGAAQDNPYRADRDRRRCATSRSRRTIRHISLPAAAHLAANEVTRAWIERYAPGVADRPQTADLDTRNILHAADIWFSVKKHWCLEAQRLVRAHRARRCRRGADLGGPPESVSADDAALARPASVQRRCTSCASPLPLDRARLRSGIDRHARGARPDRPRASTCRRWRFRYEGGPAEGGARGPGGPAPTPSASLRGEIERNSTRRFPTSCARPLRSGSSPSTPATSSISALAYDHFVAGGDSIALLLRDIAERTPAAPRRGRSVRTARSCIRRPIAACSCAIPWGRRRPAPPPADGGDLAPRRSVRGTAATTMQSQRVHILPPRSRGSSTALRRAGKAWGVTFNDLVAGQSVCRRCRRSPPSVRDSAGEELAVASIVNSREDFGAGGARALSPFLASFRVAHPVPEGIGLRELAQDVHAETARIKRDNALSADIIALGLSALMWPFLSAARRARFYAKYHPVWAGVTTLNVDALWGKSGRRDVHRWTTSGRFRPGRCARWCSRSRPRGTSLHVGVSYRTAAFSRGDRGRGGERRSSAASRVSEEPMLEMPEPPFSVDPAPARRCRLCDDAAERPSRAPRSADARAGRRPCGRRAVDPAIQDRILALDPERVTDADVRTVLAAGPTPRIISVHGGIYPGPPRDGVVRAVPGRHGLSGERRSAIRATAGCRTAPTRAARRSPARSRGTTSATACGR